MKREIRDPQSFVNAPTPGSASSLALLTPNQRCVYDIILERGALSTRELQEILGWSPSKIRGQIRGLLTHLLIERTASAKSSPKQTYRVAP